MCRESSGCDTCKQDPHSKDTCNLHRDLVDELEKTKERLVQLERRLQGKEFDIAPTPYHLPPPYSDIVFQTSEGRKVYGHKVVLVSYLLAEVMEYIFELSLMIVALYYLQSNNLFFLCQQASQSEVFKVMFSVPMEKEL